MRFLLLGAIAVLLLVAVWDKVGRHGPTTGLADIAASRLPNLPTSAPAPTATPQAAASQDTLLNRQADILAKRQRLDLEQKRLLQLQSQLTALRQAPVNTNTNAHARERDLTGQIAELKARLAQIEDSEATLVNRTQASKDAEAIGIVNRREALEIQIRNNRQEQENLKLRILQWQTANPTPTPGFYPAPTVTPSSELANFHVQMLGLQNDEVALNAQLQNLKNEGERQSLMVSQQANLAQADLQLEKNRINRELQDLTAELNAGRSQAQNNSETNRTSRIQDLQSQIDQQQRRVSELQNSSAPNSNTR